ncbi:hypothetical protein ACPV5U_19375 [Vibrio mediterranei]
MKNTVSVVLVLLVSGCMTTDFENRQFTHEVLDARVDQTKSGAVLVRQSELIMEDLSASDEALMAHDVVTNKYARTYVEGVVRNSEPMERLSELTAQEKSDFLSKGTDYVGFSKYSSEDRILIDAGSKVIAYYCGANTRVLTDRNPKKTGFVTGKFEDGKCYQAITKLNNKYFGFNEINSLGQKGRTIGSDEINWFKQCERETVIEEVDCSTLE